MSTTERMNRPPEKAVDEKAVLDPAIPLFKRSKKAQRAYHSLRRLDWNGVKPVTRVVADKTKYNRKRWKREEDDF